MIEPRAKEGRVIRAAQAALCCAIIMLAPACTEPLGTKAPATPEDPSRATAVKFDTKDGLRPDANPGPEATLAMAGVEIPVDLEHRVESGRVVLLLKAYNEVVEDETYDNPPSGFGLASAAGEQYTPPIPLLKFPLSVGDSWEWTGTMGAGGVSRKAKAKIRTAAAPVNEESSSDDAIRVAVELAMEGGGPEPAMRKLAFWFLPGKGLVQREFGVGSSRRPGHPKPTVEETEAE